MSVKFTDNSDEVLDELENALDVALEEVGLTAEGYAKKKCPVDTGRLRNSISHDVKEKTAYIGTNVEYAPYVELGTVNTKAQPFLKPAIQDHVSQYIAMVKKRLQNN